MYRFISSEGIETALESAEAFVKAVHEGRISDDDLLLDPANNRWCRASDVEIFRVARATAYLDARNADAPSSEQEATSTQSCSSCGNETELSAAYCIRCGAMLIASDDEHWHYAYNEGERGPVPLDVIRSLLATGELAADTQVKGPNMIYWIRANTLPQFADLFAQHRSDNQRDSSQVPNNPVKADVRSGEAYSTETPSVTLITQHAPLLDEEGIEPDRLQSTLMRMKAFIGPNWSEHYQNSFQRMLQRELEGRDSVGWSWNWAAALLPTWWWYRRLYGAFFLFLGIYTVIRILDNSIAGTPDGGSPVALLFFVQVVIQGWLGDRLLFARARHLVAQPLDKSVLVAMGRPNRWAIWVPLGILLLVFLIVLWAAVAGL